MCDRDARDLFIDVHGSYPESLLQLRNCEITRPFKERYDTTFLKDVFHEDSIDRRTFTEMCAESRDFARIVDSLISNIQQQEHCEGHRRWPKVSWFIRDK